MVVSDIIHGYTSVSIFIDFMRLFKAARFDLLTEMLLKVHVI
jgi:hypothetical protein